MRTKKLKGTKFGPLYFAGHTHNNVVQAALAIRDFIIRGFENHGLKYYE